MHNLKQKVQENSDIFTGLIECLSGFGITCLITQYSPTVNTPISSAIGLWQKGPLPNVCPGNPESGKLHQLENFAEQSNNWSQQWFATEVSLQIPKNKICHVFASLHSATSNMRQKHNIIEFEQLFRNMWFVFKHIKSGPT